MIKWLGVTALDMTSEFYLRPRRNGRQESAKLLKNETQLGRNYRGALTLYGGASGNEHITTPPTKKIREATNYEIHETKESLKMVARMTYGE